MPSLSERLVPVALKGVKNKVNISNEYKKELEWDGSTMEVKII